MMAPGVTPGSFTRALAPSLFTRPLLSALFAVGTPHAATPPPPIYALMALLAIALALVHPHAVSPHLVHPHAVSSANKAVNAAVHVAHGKADAHENPENSGDNKARSRLHEQDDSDPCDGAHDHGAQGIGEGRQLPR
eukprot:CAMPEP_0118880692 /NCGR_PEP_ID=MMETSP1163-20130328/20238_1 /TAXON_ID=124430 /ORGANISM="Phaeomonas parva, Strain CCMP2877" /LENGTH=136 /DNA_ID=CAMNT_0006817193 /DNA_START=414 /DNA_END=825 /DNA_ORIENTATION=+